MGNGKSPKTKCTLFFLEHSIFTKRQYFRLVKPEAFADYKINENKNLEFVVVRVENIAGKGENAGNQHFLLFPPCFQKASFSRSLKVGIVW